MPPFELFSLQINLWWYTRWRCGNVFRSFVQIDCEPHCLKFQSSDKLLPRRTSMSTLFMITYTHEVKQCSYWNSISQWWRRMEVWSIIVTWNDFHSPTFPIISLKSALFFLALSLLPPHGANDGRRSTMVLGWVGESGRSPGASRTWATW